jgi:small subunit ribosomal protein S16
LEPKYLPTGPQTENALKAVRFPTHLPPKAKLKGEEKEKGAVMEAVQGGVRRKRGVGVGTTSPMDPNQS